MVSSKISQLGLYEKLHIIEASMHYKTSFVNKQNIDIIYLNEFINNKPTKKHMIKKSLQAH